MQVYSFDLQLILWTLFWVVLVSFAGFLIYRFFRKKNRNSSKDPRQLF